MRDQIAHLLPGVYNADKTYAWVWTWQSIADHFHLQEASEDVQNLGYSYVMPVSTVRRRPADYPQLADSF
jgi:hypothetical protein